jgi:hypothetical protein
MWVFAFNGTLMQFGYQGNNAELHEDYSQNLGNSLTQEANLFSASCGILRSLAFPVASELLAHIISACVPIINLTQRRQDAKNLRVFYYGHTTGHDIKHKPEFFPLS